MRKLSVLFLLFAALQVSAQQPPQADSVRDGAMQQVATIRHEPTPGKLQFILEYQDLYSTHSDHFRGGSLTLARQVSPLFRLGAGVEFAGNDTHLDNGWSLTNLRFVPVFLDQQLRLPHSRRLYPVLHVSEGLSYQSYGKETAELPGQKEQRREVGVYFYAGSGLVWKVTDKIGLVAEGGFKGYHMSFNEYDVNPHGLTFRVGLIF